jgi:hypothetical protein
MSEYLNKDKVYHKAKEYWEGHLKNVMPFEVYYEQIKDQLNIYYSLPDDDKRKFLDTRMMLLNKAEREIKKMKETYYKMKDKK